MDVKERSGGKVRSSGKDYNMNKRFKKKTGKRAQPQVNKVINTYWWKIGKNTPYERRGPGRSSHRPKL